jgi:hypothetical protein
MYSTCSSLSLSLALTFTQQVQMRAASYSMNCKRAVQNLTKHTTNAAKERKNFSINASVENTFSQVILFNPSTDFHHRRHSPAFFFWKQDWQ